MTGLFCTLARPPPMLPAPAMLPAAGFGDAVRLLKACCGGVDEEGWLVSRLSPSSMSAEEALFFSSDIPVRAAAAEEVVEEVEVGVEENG
jgi:hypothetical protein